MISINPGFALLLGAALIALAPRIARFPVFLISAIGACAMLFVPAFGEYASISQIGIELAPLRLDALSQGFGLCVALVGIIAALASSTRDDRLEDFAIATHIGAALVAVCAGDLVTFIAAAELSALASVALIAKRGPSARGASMRLFAWHAVAGACLLTGAAFNLAEGAPGQFQAFDARSAGGALMLIGLCVRVGAPLAHIWLREALHLASPVGACALAATTATLASYGLSRAFAGEQSLIIIGALMAGVALLFAPAQGDLRRAAAYAMLAQYGLIVALIGIGGSHGLHAAAAHAFSTCIAGAALALGLGLAVLNAQGRPICDGLFAGLDLRLAVALSGLCLVGVPGTMGFMSLAMAHDAIQSDARVLIGIVFAGAVGAAAVHTGLRFLTALSPFPGDQRPDESAIFSAKLGLLLAAFLIVAAGVSPGWLMSFAPAAAAQDALTREAMLGLLGPLGVGFAVGFIIRALGLSVNPYAANLRDWDEALSAPIDGIWRRATAFAPLAGARIAAWNMAAGDKLLNFARALLAQGDRPGRAAGQGDAVLLVAIAFGLVWVLVGMTA